MVLKTTYKIFVTGLLLSVNVCFGQFKPVTHRTPEAGEIPVSAPGNYSEPGKTYILVNDITSDRSAIFLGKDVTLDLNGYTIRYADGKYNHIPNSGFEEGLKDWDISKAPGAKVMNTADVHVFVGDKLLSLQKGDEIRSEYIELPVANRSYIAMCGITGRHFGDSLMKGDLRNEMKLSIFVEDEKGNEVSCITQYRDTTMESASVEKRSPRLGGGFIYAHLNKLPAAKYRMRIRADTDCLIDEIDIRPAFDVGVGIVDQTYANGHNDHLYNSAFTAFFDYTADVKKGIPAKGIPVVKGGGNVVIKNGSIENATKGAISWGIQSTADEVKIILSNVLFKTSGINTTAVDVLQATIVNCRFEVENPFIINRHGSNFYAVDLRGTQASEVSFSEFFGGQGCLVFKGKHSDIHHNYFVNNQSVTNHYSIMAMGDSSKIFDNRIEPQRGSGIEIYTRKYIDIFNNIIRVQSSPPTCEYGREEYSANAIRIADYRALPGASNGAFGNRVYNNRIYIKAINFPEPEEYVPLTWAFFYSASGGDNEIFGNDIVIEHTAPASKALAAAFFITGGTKGFGGNFYNNRITSNVPAVWIAGKYGGTINTKIFDNIIIKSPGALPDFTPFRMGFGGCGDCIAKNVELASNEVINDRFTIHVEGKDHSYSVNWKLMLRVKNRQNEAAAGMEVIITDADKTEVFRGRTTLQGSIEVNLPEYRVNDNIKKQSSPYTIQCGGISKIVQLGRDTALTILLRK
ncbi:MAG: right-handed parallel beta-helix repeat-containing protein [Chitinophagaceae bacterium]|nr:right-handed parallel beta-helix repeat-containing protein [Chitinophagaceae bacterium]